MSNYSSADQSQVERGFGHYGCSHSKRRCRIRASCCNEIFYCRLCHNESNDSILVDPSDRHQIRHHEIEHHDIETVQKHCIQCGVCMGKYFCSECKFFDDDVSKDQFHCNECGICRIGGAENYFHCSECGSCYRTGSRDSHKHRKCPGCSDDLYPLKERPVGRLRCRHAIHLECMRQLEDDFQFSCPDCSLPFYSSPAREKWMLGEMMR